MWTPISSPRIKYRPSPVLYIKFPPALCQAKLPETGSLVDFWLVLSLWILCKWNYTVYSFLCLAWLLLLNYYLWDSSMLLLPIEPFYCYIIWNYIKFWNLFIQSPAVRYSGCFQFVPIVNKAGKKINNVGLNIKITQNKCSKYVKLFSSIMW